MDLRGKLAREAQRNQTKKAKRHSTGQPNINSKPARSSKKAILGR